MALRFLVVGTNFISDRFIEAARTVDGVEIFAVYSRTRERGEEFAKKHHLKKAFDSYAEALSASEIDAVYIANPNFAHKETALAAIRAHKHVFCEKIITENLTDFLLLRDEAKNCGVVLLEAMRPDFDPAAEVLKNALPLVGTLRRVALEYCQYSSRYDAFLRGEVQNAFDPSIGNSSLADIGIYPLHLLVSLFGEPRDACAFGISLSNGFLGSGSILADYSDRGFLATVDFSKITESARPSVIEGELGSLLINKVNATSKITFCPRGAAPVILYDNELANNMNFEISAFRDMTLGIISPGDYLDVTEQTMRTYDRVVAMLS